MTPDEWQRIKTIYLRVRELTEPEARAAYLEAACANDPAVRAEVDRMLGAPADSDHWWSGASSLQGQTVGHYQILEKVADSGGGIVYKAQDTRLSRWVVLKVLPHQLMSDEEALRRFQQESRCLSALSHPNIVTIYGIEPVGPAVALVMEYVAGPTLAARLADGPLGWPVARHYALQIASALAAAHGRGIIHRDLKPSNVIVTKEERLKVLDFGLAKAVPPLVNAPDDQTQTGAILGTAGYLAPEQARGERVDGRSDLFSFGVLLYEMLTGTRAFAGASLLDMMAAIVRDPVPPLPASVPRPLGRIVDRCLEKDPGQRFQSAEEVLSALQRASREPPSRRAITGIACAPILAAILWIALAHRGSLPGVSAHSEAEQVASSAAAAFDRAIDFQRKAMATGCLKDGAPSCDVPAALLNVRASIREFDAILKGHPRHAPSQWNRGLAYADLCSLHRRLQQWPHALEACEQAIQDFNQALLPGLTYDGLPSRSPDEGDVLLNRGLTYQQKADTPPQEVNGKIAELTRAIADYNQILSDAQYRAFVQKRRGDILTAKQIAEDMRRGLLAQNPPR